MQNPWVIKMNLKVEPEQMSEKSGEIIWRCHMATVQVAALLMRLYPRTICACTSLFVYLPSSLKKGALTHFSGLRLDIYLFYLKKKQTNRFSLCLTLEAIVSDISR